MHVAVAFETTFSIVSTTRGRRSFHFAGNTTSYHLSRFALGNGASHRIEHAPTNFLETLRCTPLALLTSSIGTNEVSGKLVVGARPQRITPNDDSEHSFNNIEEIIIMLLVIKIQIIQIFIQ